MTVIEKNSGTKISYEVVKNKICFDDDLTINLAKREDDRDVHIDVCYDSYGELVIGAAAGRSYVAEIDIPARRYTQPEPIEEVTADGEENAEVEALIRARADAKKAKNFAEADRIRDELKAQGIEITDVPGGAKWKRI